MCTVTWMHTSGGYELFSNRDERRTRAAASPPRSAVAKGVEFVAPRDGDASGTWISVNELGIAVCILNGAILGGKSAGSGQASVSRGRIPLNLAGCDSQDAALDTLDKSRLTDFAAFTMVILEPGLRAALAEWDGTRLSVLPNADPFVPLASSSLDACGVRAIRAQQFSTLAISVETLKEFHASHDPRPGPYSPCMHRPDASTVSFTHVSVTPERITMRYQPGAPCERRPACSVELNGYASIHRALHAAE